MGCSRFRPGVLAPGGGRRRGCRFGDDVGSLVPCGCHPGRWGTEVRPDNFEDPFTGPIPIVTAGAPADDSGAPLDNKRKIAEAWRDRRTLLLGVMVLGLALAEGAAGDWVALAMADGHGQTDAAGAAGYGLFVTFMTIGRFAGTVVLDRFGRVPVMRWCAALAVFGLGLFVFSPFLGSPLWHWPSGDSAHRWVSR
ncbi:inner membrane protein YbjJ [Arthrobacter sp. Hiyo4]|nr:inner membrane protein YbjJ [Arthrobacter sp. Hiyo4]